MRRRCRPCRQSMRRNSPRNISVHWSIPDHTQPVQESTTMGIFSKEIQSFDDLLLHGLQDIYYAEQQITKALPKMIDKATNRDLTTALKKHLEETNNQIGRLDQVFKKLGQMPKGTTCPAIDGLIKEADEVA